MKKPALLMTALLVGVIEVQAQQNQPNVGNEDDTVFQLSLVPDIALFPKTTTVNGFSLNIWGENPQHGVALGLINGSTDESAGFSFGIVNYDDTYRGVQWGFVNVSKQDFIGWQRGFVNFSQGSFTGFQDGFLNFSEEVTGFQFGLVNYTQQLKGLQIGIVNVAMNNPWFEEFPDKLATGFPIVNWSF